ncbi:MAG: hypothetical protein AAGF11_02210 [Myxococcota bacterium]
MRRKIIAATPKVEPLGIAIQRSNAFVVIGPLTDTNVLHRRRLIPPTGTPKTISRCALSYTTLKIFVGRRLPDSTLWTNLDLTPPLAGFDTMLEQIDIVTPTLTIGDLSTTSRNDNGDEHRKRR